MLQLLCEMDQKVEIKEEPVWPEGTASTSFDSCELVSEKSHFKEEIKSELAEPGQTQLSGDVKDEVFVEEQTVGQLVPCFKEEDNVQNDATFTRNLTRNLMDSYDNCCKLLKTGSELRCQLPTDTERQCHCNIHSQHLLSCADNKSFHCTGCISLKGQTSHCYNECGWTFSLKNALNKQMLIHTGDAPLLSLKGTHQDHMPINTEKRSYQCSVCGRIFLRKSHLVSHMVIHTGERKFRCSKCVKTFSRKGSLSAHMLCHSTERPHCCSECGKTFRRKCDIDKHSLSHRGEWLHCCTICGKCFSIKSRLIKHTQTHTGERRHSCSLCDKSFALKTNLKKHSLTHTGERPFCCTVCGMTFSAKITLVKHLPIHTGHRPHVCNDCGKRFSLKYSLKQHMLTHTRERALSCSECGKAFSQKSNLKAHMLIHT